MKAKQPPDFETIMPVRQSTQRKTVKVTILLICALAVSVFIVVFQLYVLLYFLALITLITLGYAIKTKYWGENTRQWYEEEWYGEKQKENGRDS